MSRLLRSHVSPPYVERIVERMHEAETELAREVDAQRDRWHYRIHRGRVRFDRDIRPRTSSSTGTRSRI